MTSTITYTAADKTAAISKLESGIDCNGDRIDPTTKARAIHILNRMAVAGTFTVDFDNANGWTATLHAQSALAEAVTDRKREPRPETPKAGRGPERLEGMF